MAADTQRPSQEDSDREGKTVGNDTGVSRNAAHVGQRISDFIKFIQPYRDLLALFVALVVAISAATAWVTTYFATRVQVSHLECRTFDKIHAATKPLQSNIGRLTAQWDRREAQRLLMIQNKIPLQLSYCRRLTQLRLHKTTLTLSRINNSPMTLRNVIAAPKQNRLCQDDQHNLCANKCTQGCDFRQLFAIYGRC
jgi:hypothetical protein